MCIVQCCNFKNGEEIITKKLASYMKWGFATLQGKRGGASQTAHCREQVQGK